MIEVFHGTPVISASAANGTTFTWVSPEAGMGHVPVVGIRASHGSHTTVTIATISDPALLRQLVAELSIGIDYLEGCAR